MGDKEDVERRKQLSNAALYKLKNIWIGKDKINHNIKIKLGYIKHSSSLS